MEGGYPMTHQKEEPGIPKYKRNSPKLDLKTQRRILRFINNARSPQQLVDGPEKPFAEHAEHRGRGHPDPHEIRDAHLKSRQLLDLEEEKKLIELRGRRSPLYGFLNLDELLENRNLKPFLDALSVHLSAAAKGEWQRPFSIPGAMDRPIHAALLRTGDVLFFGGIPSGTVTYRYTPDPAGGRLHAGDECPERLAVLFRPRAPVRRSASGRGWWRRRDRAAAQPCLDLRPGHRCVDPDGRSERVSLVCDADQLGRPARSDSRRLRAERRHRRRAAGALSRGFRRVRERLGARYVREEKLLSLMDALRKMTLMPAQRLERRAPIMKNKGRIRVGADADLTIFDRGRIGDRATYSQPTLPPDGIRYVIVNGTVVLRDGRLQDSVPGRAIRAPQHRRL